MPGGDVASDVGGEAMMMMVVNVDVKMRMLVQLALLNCPEGWVGLVPSGAPPVRWELLATS